MSKSRKAQGTISESNIKLLLSDVIPRLLAKQLIDL